MHTSPAAFLNNYPPEVAALALDLRVLLLDRLPGVEEVVDLPAKMVAYAYGQRYTDMICTIIPSKKGVKLGFNKGPELPDPAGLLEGAGKLSRYVQMSPQRMGSAALLQLVDAGLAAYRERSQK